MTTNTSERVQQESHPRQADTASTSDELFQRLAGSVLLSPLYPLSTRDAMRVAVSSNAPVLVTGERGTRKKGLARAIHREGLQKENGFFVVKAEQFEEDIRHLLEGERELRGTLLIRGIDRLTEAMQAVLEDYLDSGEMTLDGVSRPASLRLIMTSEVDAVAMVADSLIERTLLHRLSIVGLDLPPLRSRKKDIPLIAGYLRDRVCRNYALPEKEISPQALDYLARAFWSDNLDELEGVIARGLAACTEEMVMPWHLSLSSGVEEPAARDCSEPISQGEAKEEQAASPEDLSTAATAHCADSSLAMALQLAHEIKNPLVSIKTYTNLLKDKFGDEEFRSEFYQVMTSDVEKIDRVVEEILTSARVQGEPSDGQAAEIEHVDVNEMIDALLGEFREKLAGRKIAVFRFLGDDIPGVPMENAQSREAMGGLLLSIIDHISDNGDIYISTGCKTLEGQEDIGQAVEVTLEGNPFEGDLVKLGTDIVWQQKILKSQGGRVELKELDGGGVAATILLPFAGTDTSL
ncbi:MAG: sigma 54-interacting transcriptional regulator [Nitrospirota bacterium]|nr:sigma 54-interacting transcriptional regulator [Nitrospirota bacterium]